MKICIIGSNGQLGSDLYQTLKEHDLIPLTHSDIEIAEEKACIDSLKYLRPDVIINTAAFHNVPLCEKEPQNALKTNFSGVMNLAKAAELLHAELIHYSTDYVFDGLKKEPYIETDLPNPLNLYGLSKLAGEHAIRIYCSRYKILRIGGIYGKVPCRAKNHTNFVTVMLKLGKEKKEIDVVSDEFLSPTNTMDIARQTVLLLKSPENGIFHVSNKGFCSWFEFAVEIFKLCHMQIKVNPVLSATRPSEIKRPSWSVMENRRLKELGIHVMRDWKEALSEHFKNSSLLSF